MRRSSHQTTAALQTCDSRSASALFSRGQNWGDPRRQKQGERAPEMSQHLSRGRESNPRITGLQPVAFPCDLDSRGLRVSAHHRAPGAPRASLQEAGESNPAGRFWRPARSPDRFLWGDRPVSIRNLRVHSATCRATTPRSPRHTNLVPPSGIEPASPGLQPGAITRSATEASVAGVVPGHGHGRLFGCHRTTNDESGSGTRNRTSIDRFKACRPAVGRSPITLGTGLSRSRKPDGSLVSCRLRK